MTGIETVKERSRPFYKFVGNETVRYFSTDYSQVRNFSITGRQYTRSTGNPHHLIGRTGRDIGSNFITKDQFVTVDGVELNPFGNNKLRTYSITYDQNNLYQHYTGPRLAQDISVALADFHTPIVPDVTSLNALGTTAISRTIPTRTEANLAEFLGELREGLPKLVGAHLWQTRLKDFRALGGEYLNYKFGWESLVRDIREFFTAVSDGDKILAQLERDSGKTVRRSYYFQPVLHADTPVVVSNQGLYPYLSTTLSPNEGTKTFQSFTEEKVWFKGGFSYYLSPKTRNRVAEIARKADYLLNLELTPELLWNLAPWSWVADYFANVGDVMTNISYFSQDNLLLRYGYVMKTTKRWSEYTWTGPIPGYGLTTTSICGGDITKQRVKATPYGFGFNTGGLNNSQWAILVALGIARAPQLL